VPVKYLKLMDLFAPQAKEQIVLQNLANSTEEVGLLQLFFTLLG
jgi:hypothetical protein